MLGVDRVGCRALVRVGLAPGQPHHGVDLAVADAEALEQAVVERGQRGPCVAHRVGRPADRHLIAAAGERDPELPLDSR